MSHCIAQTPEFHAVLRNIDVNLSSGALKRQPQAVQSALLPLYNTQNGGRAYDCFNLKALTAEVNVKKGAVFKAMLLSARHFCCVCLCALLSSPHAEEAETGGDFRRSDFNVRSRLQTTLQAAAACGGSEDAAARVSDALLAELRGAADIYVDRLSCGLPPGPLTARTVGAVARANSGALALAEAVKELSARIIDE